MAESVGHDELRRMLGGLLDEKLAPLESKVNGLETTVGTLQTTVGALVEANIRKEASQMFGISFAKRFLVKSLHDAVHLVTKAKYKDLTPEAVDKRIEAAALLAKKAEEFAIPLAKAFLLSFDAMEYGDTTLAKEAFDEEDYSKGLGLLLLEAKTNPEKVPKNAGKKIGRLKKAFSSDLGPKVLTSALVNCDGPGVMLMELACKYTVSKLASDSDIFAKGKLHEQIENDLRGYISLVGNHATIICGEAKSSFAGLVKGKQQLIVRTSSVVATIFAGIFHDFPLIGHLFVPFPATEDGATHRPPHELPGNIGEEVSIYIHAV